MTLCGPVFLENTLIQKYLLHFQWQQINRERDKVAHELAQQSSRYRGAMFSLFEAPECVSSLIEAEGIRDCAVSVPEPHEGPGAGSCTVTP